MRGGGSCHINVSLINSCTLQITVEDDGCDVSEKALLHLDESFFRVNNSRSNVKGSGLGLAISKRILMNHGASVLTEVMICQLLHGVNSQMMVDLEQQPMNQVLGMHGKMLGWIPV